MKGQDGQSRARRRRSPPTSPKSTTSRFVSSGIWSMSPSGGIECPLSRSKIRICGPRLSSRSRRSPTSRIFPALTACPSRRPIPLLADPKGYVERQVEKYGPVYRSRAFGGRSISLLGPEANEFVLFDQIEDIFVHARLGLVLEKLFPRGLMLLDFDEHRLHRKALSVAFKTGPMQSYLFSLNAGIERGLAQWRANGPDILFYPAIKQSTLDLAAGRFWALTWAPM